ncbi:MAG TPA: NAD(P)-dependent alcohol dehydrogenase, partial [Candidatus Binataceae bacterium]|nr:NAD(P)-dependent alcohol dehydrogenase [Candidatus Binataceae bacterium]
MKLYEIAEPEGIESLKVAERPPPKPGPGEVLMRVRAVSLNYRDLAMVKGGLGRMMKLPLVPVSDGAGDVVETGPGVLRLKKGDRIAAIFTQGWLAGPPYAGMYSSSLGGGIDGMLAEYVVLREDGFVRIPDYMTFEDAATLPCAAVTSWNALVVEGHLRSGDTVLVMGTGGVSIFALQIALIHGARVIATSSSDAKLERLKELGASEVINYKTTPGWDKRTLEATGGLGVDHVVEVGGAGT